MTGWKSQIDLNTPCWDGYRTFLEALPSDSFPDTDSLNACLPSTAENQNGLPIRFVPATALPGVNYERHIYETGQVPTRENNWHDLFNALVWCRLPQLKARLNRMHYETPDQGHGGRRGEVRDALTLLDESGVIVQGTNPTVLDALARHDWNSVFLTYREDWGKELRVQVCGHAILEKFLDPYKSITAHALLIHTPHLLSTEELDNILAFSLAEKRWLKSPSGLSPLPLAGLPGWWKSGPQGSVFYDDPQVFRSPSPGRRPAPIHTLHSSGNSAFSPPG
jgi:hypothetical protein